MEQVAPELFLLSSGKSQNQLKSLKVTKSAQEPNYRANYKGTTSTSEAHTHEVTINSSGGGKAHENRPPYYALCFIMKL